MFAQIRLFHWRGVGFLFCMLYANATYGQQNCGTILSTEADSLWFYSLPWVGNNDLLIDYLDDKKARIETASDQRIQNGGITSAQYRIPVQAIILNRDDGTGGIEDFEVDQYIRMVNNLYRANSTEIQFYLICDPIEIDDTFFFEEILLGVGADTLFDLVDSYGAIDLFFVDTLRADGIGAYPYAVNAFHSVVRTRRPSVELVSGSIAHEFGHNFSLLHTSECTRNSTQPNNHKCGRCKQESVSRTRTQGALCAFTGTLKCELNGDALCDTPADPLLDVGDNVQVTPTGCVFTASSSGNIRDTDRWGDSWIPELTNIMGLADECRGSFSPMQVAAMQMTINSYIPQYWQIPENDFDVFEPDNYPESAQAIASGEVQCRTFHWSRTGAEVYQNCDEDWLRFETTTFGAVKIKTWESPGWPQPDTELELFDDNLNLIANTNFSVGLFAWIAQVNLPIGEYFIRVTNSAPHPTPASRGHYNISVELGAPVGAKEQFVIEQQISVFPQPASEWLNIEYRGERPLNGEWKIVGLDGRSIVSGLATLQPGKAAQIELLSVVGGAYFLQMRFEDFMLTKKVYVFKTK